MAVQATLVYTITRVGPMTVAKLNTLVGAVTLNHAQLIPFGCTLTSDVVATVGNTVTRTIVYALNATFNQQTPNNLAQQRAVFTNYWSRVLSTALKANVVSSVPAII